MFLFFSYSLRSSPYPYHFSVEHIPFLRFFNSVSTSSCPFSITTSSWPFSITTSCYPFSIPTSYGPFSITTSACPFSVNTSCGPFSMTASPGPFPMTTIRYPQNPPILFNSFLSLTISCYLPHDLLISSSLAITPSIYAIYSRNFALS